MVRLGIIIWLFSLSLAAPADWLLQNAQSSFYFASIKKAHTFETHRFDALAGSIDPQGHARLEIDLTSVNTGIQIRDQRMRAMLFDANLHPKAVFETRISTDLLQRLQPGEVTGLQVDGELKLHGISRRLQTDLIVTRLSPAQLLVYTPRPVVIMADSFAMEGGVEALRAVANLTSISLAVPVNFSLLFQQRE